MKNKIIVLSGCLLIVIIIIFIFSHKNKKIVEVEASSDIIKESNNKDDKKETEIIKVDIKGAIKKPGVYEVEVNKRVIDVISLAGGLNKNANTNYINLSEKVKDEMVIWIYTSKEIEQFKLKQDSSEYMIKSCNCPVVDNTTCLNNNTKEEKKDTIININTASLEELMSLNGLGESKAKSIIEYRNKNGKFNSIEDIMNVKGIGESLYNKIKNNIKV